MIKRTWVDGTSSRTITRELKTNLDNLKVAPHIHYQESQVRPLITPARRVASQMAKDNLIGTIAKRYQITIGAKPSKGMASKYR